jgi:hypothetical protein
MTHVQTPPTQEYLGQVEVVWGGRHMGGVEVAKRRYVTLFDILAEVSDAEQHRIAMDRYLSSRFSGIKSASLSDGFLSASEVQRRAEKWLILHRAARLRQGIDEPVVMHDIRILAQDAPPREAVATVRGMLLASYPVYARALRLLEEAQQAAMDADHWPAVAMQYRALTERLT